MGIGNQNAFPTDSKSCAGTEDSTPYVSRGCLCAGEQILARISQERNPKFVRRAGVLRKLAGLLQCGSIFDELLFSDGERFGICQIEVAPYVHDKHRWLGSNHLQFWRNLGLSEQCSRTHRE
ncbi:MAG: hypothetical protein U0795_26380 [Pirellulales bacterium]